MINKLFTFKRLALFIAAIAVICTVFIKVGYMNDRSRESSIVATVDGEPITVQELMPKLVKHRAEVFDYFKKKHDVDPGKAFWTSSFDGEIPAEMLKKIALDECVRIKVQQILGKEEGLVKDIGYARFLEDWKKENERRKTALEQKKVIYGPEQYTEDVYFSIVFTDMTEKLKEKSEELLPVSEEEITQYYDEAIKENKYKKTEKVVVEKIDFPFSATDDKSKRAAKETAEEAREKLASGERVGGLSRQIFDSTTYREDYMPATHDFTDKAVALSVGQVSEVFEHGKAYYVVKCIEKTDEGFNDLKEVNDKIKEVLKEKKYASYVDDLVKNAAVVIDKKAYEKLEIM